MSGIRIKHYHFKATLIPSIVTLALLYLMISLGLWQLERADYKANLQSMIESKQDAPPIALNSIAKNEDDWLYQPVFARGEFDTQHQLLLDNQVRKMVAGYSVFTPLKLSSDLGILVNRGWLPIGASRSELPDVSIGLIKQKINGLASKPPSKGLVLSSNVNQFLKWPAVMQFIDLQEIQKQLDYKLMPMIIVMNQAAQTPLNISPIKINMRSEKHTGYAFQWFGLSLALFIIYIVVNTKNINRD